MRPAPVRREYGAALPVPCRGLAGTGHLGRRRIGHDDAGIRVDEHGSVVRQRKDVWIDADDQWQPDRTRDDRGVRVGTATYRDGRDEALTEVFEQIGRAQLGGDQDEPSRRRGPAVGAAEPLDDPPADLAYVGGPLAQRLVG